MAQTMHIPQSRTGARSSRRSRQRARILDLRTLKGQFILHASLILFCAALLTVNATMTVDRSISDLDTINSGSIPSVDAAQAITQYIEVIDAQSADYLAAAGLRNLAPCTIAATSGAQSVQSLTVHDCDEHNIDVETVQVNEQLYLAAHNVTYPGERTAVERITIGLESYLEDIHQMRVDYALAAQKTDPTDPYLRQAYQAYLQASAILHNQISLATLGSGQIPLDREADLPACTPPGGQSLSPAQWTQGGLTTALDCLSVINYTHLQTAYADSENFLSGSIAQIVTLEILLCLLLCITTGRMIAATHRILNPGLLAAILLALIFGLSLIGLLSSLPGQGALASQDGAFRQMVLDDYNSVYYSALLKRYSTDANADESRWLIAQEFKDQASIAHWQADWESNIQRVSDLMHQAHNNQTWPEEIQPLNDMDTFWQRYTTLDQQMRGLATSTGDAQHIAHAEALSTGQSNQVFTSFTGAIDRLSQANRDHYTRTFAATHGALLTDLWLGLVLFPLAGLLACGGIVFRLSDF